MIDPDAFLMTLAEARSVRWLKNNPRPLGELFDEGYLDKSRLEWAVARACSARLRRAAMVLLKESPPPPEPSASSDSPQPAPALAQAEATPWPFSPCKGQPMGALIQTRRISLKDLGYAAENAWDPAVRQAAGMLLEQRLERQQAEPAPSAGYMKWISGGSAFTGFKQLEFTLWQGLILGALLGALLAAFAIYLFARPASFYADLRPATLLQSPAGVAGLLLTLMLVLLVLLSFLIISRLLKRLDREIDNYRQAEAGETRTAEVIRQNLDGTWTLFRSLRLPGRRRAALGAVLVGPAGVWALEVASLGGPVRNTADKWEVRLNNRWVPTRASPSRQASAAAARLAGFLKPEGVRQVESAVVWAAEDCLHTVENPSVPVWPLERLPDELGNLWQEETLPTEARLRIVDKLTRLCEKK